MRTAASATGAPRRSSSSFLAAVLVASVQFPAAPAGGGAADVRARSAWLPSGVKRGEAQRSFFGVYRVQPSADGAVPHPDARHDAARRAALATRRASRSTTRRRPPTTTRAARSARPSPSGASCSAPRARRAATASSASAPARSACHKQEGETWRFFEIDPAVIKHRQEPEELHLHREVPARHRHRHRRRAADHGQGARRQLRPLHHRCLLLRRHPGAHADGGGGAALPRQAEARRRGAAAHLQPLPRPRTRCWAPPKELPAGTAGIVVSDDDADGSYAQSTSTVVIFAKSEEALQPYRSLEGVMRARRRRPAGLDRRLLRHPGRVPEQAAGAGDNADTAGAATASRALRGDREDGVGRAGGGPYHLVGEQASSM